MLSMINTEAHIMSKDEGFRPDSDVRIFGDDEFPDSLAPEATDYAVNRFLSSKTVRNTK